MKNSVDHTPAVSVIIPVYNVERYLRECVESVLSQTFRDFEIILVDDESPDGCPKICDDYAAADPRIRVIHKKNGGLGFARNSGLDVARGLYVCFLDSDDVIDPQTLSCCYEIAEKEGADEVRYLFKRFSDKEIDIAPVDIAHAKIVSASGPERVDPLLNVIAPLLYPPRLDVETTCSSCTALYRRSILEGASIRFHSERELISEDYIFNIEVAYAAGRIVYTNLPFYCYRTNSNSLTSTVRADRVEKGIYFSKFLAEMMENHGMPDASTYAMGFTIGTMRHQNRLVFQSSLPLKEKRKIFYAVADNDYVKSIAGSYPIAHLPLMQRIAFHLHSRRQFLLSFAVTRLRDLWKR